MQFDPSWALLCVTCLALAITQSLRLRRSSGAMARRGKAAQRRGATAERTARQLLQANGYRIVEQQASIAWPLTVDGEPVNVDLRCDFLVCRRGKRFTADVKTGNAIRLVGKGGTRRQLLEYQLAFGADGALLVDAEGEAIHDVSFPALRSHASPLRVISLLLTMAVALWLVVFSALHCG